MVRPAPHHADRSWKGPVCSRHSTAAACFMSSPPARATSGAGGTATGSSGMWLWTGRERRTRLLAMPATPIESSPSATAAARAGRLTEGRAGRCSARRWYSPTGWAGCLRRPAGGPMPEFSSIATACAGLLRAMKACSAIKANGPGRCEKSAPLDNRSVGIEEFVTHDVIMPPKGNAVFAVEDATGLVTADTRKFVARQIPLQDQLLSNGTGSRTAPMRPSISPSSRPTSITRDRARVIPDSRRTEGRPGPGSRACPSDPSTGKPLSSAGSVAISRRGNWTSGERPPGVAA